MAGTYITKTIQLTSAGQIANTLTALGTTLANASFEVVPIGSSYYEIIVASS